MKKFVPLICCLLTISAAAFSASFKKGSKVYVTVKTGSLKESQAMFAQDVAQVSYGDTLKVVESNSKKTLVTIPSKKISGWISNGSLSSKKIVASGSASTYTDSELALAGKGFSAQSELAFVNSGITLDFVSIDSIEQITVDASELEEFITEGQLKGGNQ